MVKVVRRQDENLLQKNGLSSLISQTAKLVQVSDRYAPFCRICPAAANFLLIAWSSMKGKMDHDQPFLSSKMKEKSMEFDQSNRRGVVDPRD